LRTRSEAEWPAARARFKARTSSSSSRIVVEINRAIHSPYNERHDLAMLDHGAARAKRNHQLSDRVHQLSAVVHLGILVGIGDGVQRLVQASHLVKARRERRRVETDRDERQDGDAVAFQLELLPAAPVVLFERAREIGHESAQRPNEVWIVDLRRGGLRTRLAANPAAGLPGSLYGGDNSRVSERLSIAGQWQRPVLDPSAD